MEIKMKSLCMEAGRPVLRIVDGMTPNRGVAVWVDQGLPKVGPEHLRAEPSQTVDQWLKDRLKEGAISRECLRRELESRPDLYNPAGKTLDHTKAIAFAVLQGAGRRIGITETRMSGRRTWMLIDE